jgi:hypothetical protein
VRSASADRTKASDNKFCRDFCGKPAAAIGFDDAGPLFGKNRAGYVLVGNSLYSSKYREAPSRAPAWASPAVKGQAPGRDIAMNAPAGKFLIEDTWRGRHRMTERCRRIA